MGLWNSFLDESDMGVVWAKLQGMTSHLELGIDVCSEKSRAGWSAQDVQPSRSPISAGALFG